MKGAWIGSSEVTLDGDLCLLRGASVVINCWYSVPFAHRVTGVGWFKETGYWSYVPLPIFGDRPQHYRYLGNYIDDCRLQINDVQHEDAGNYFFSFRANFKQQKSKTFKLSVEGNNRNKPASKCLNHPSNVTHFPVIQS